MALSDLDAISATTAGITHSRRRRRAAAWGVVAGLALAGAVVGVDASADLPGSGRMAGLTLAAAATLAVALSGWRRTELNPLATAEQALGDGDRHLTAARQLSALDDPRAAAHATRLAADLPAQDAWRQTLAAKLPPAHLGLASLAGLGVLLPLGLASVLLPNFLPCEVPRFLDPFGDHPPYSAIRLVWVDPPQEFRFGEPTTLTVAALGPTPEALVLHARPAESGPESSGAPSTADLLPAGGDHWRIRLEPAERSLELWVSGQGTRTTRLVVPLDGIPRIRQAKAILTQPDYARLEPVTVRCDPAPVPVAVAALPGARVRLVIASSRPALRAELSTADGQTIPATFACQPAATKGGDATTTLDIAEPPLGRWRIALVAADGSRPPQPQILLAVERRPDAPPQVRVTLPEKDALVVKGTAIPVHVEATDDLGLRRVTISQTIAGKQILEGRHNLGGTGDGWRGSLDTHLAKPGDSIKIAAVARDTCPPDGQVSESAEVTLTVVGIEQYLAVLRDQLNEEALNERFAPVFDRLAELEEQQARLAAKPPSPARDQALAQHRMDLAEARKEFAEQAKTKLFSGDDEVFKAIDERLADLDRKAAEGAKADPGKTAERMRQELEAVTAQAEADAVQSWLDDLAKAQRQIAQDLKNVQKQPETSDARQGQVRQLARQQQELDEAVGELQDLAAKCAERLAPHDGERCRQLGKTAEGLGEVRGPTGSAARFAARNRPEAAQEPAADAASRLERLAGNKCKNSGDKPGTCQGKSLGQCRSELAALAKRCQGQGQGSSSKGQGKGALGSFGTGRFVKQGGKTPQGQTRQLIGPMSALVRSGGRAGPSDKPTPAKPGAANPLSDSHGATPYARDVRTTTAGLGAVLTPTEEVVVDGYFRRLEAEPGQTAPAPGTPALMPVPNPAPGKAP